MMNVLIFGNANSIWIKSIVEHTLLPYGDHVTILSDNTVENFLEYYKNNDIDVIVCKRLPGKIGTLLSGCTNRSILNKHYDLFCAHFITSLSLFILSSVKRHARKTVFFFWGSDLLKATNKGKLRYILRMRAFKSLDCIGVGTNEMLDKFHELYGNCFDPKIRRIYFGVNGLETLKRVNTSRKELRKKYKIDEKKIVISVGYNKMTAQQHIKVLSAIGAVQEMFRDNIHLILRLTYGNGDQKYVDEIKRAIRETKCTSSVFESYLSDEEVAEITSITDVFVQGQMTDARSATMQEHLFAKCLVINPSWIHYSELEDKVFYLTYDTFEELTEIIQVNLTPKGESRYREKLSKNAQVIDQISSWSTFVPAWRDIYLN